MNGSQRLAEKPFCGARIPLSTEQEVDRVAFRIHCSIEILPFTFDLDICFIHSIGIVRCLETSPVPYEKHRQTASCRELLTPLVSLNNVRIVFNARRKAPLVSSLSGTRLNS